MTDAGPSRTDAAHLDGEDPLAALRQRFVIEPDNRLYVDGNSLGRLPRSTAERLRHVVDREWAAGLIRSWADWIDRPQQVGDRLGATLLGAAPGQVVLADSTSVCLWRLAAAALDAAGDRRVVVTDGNNFPTDRYLLEGLAHQRGLELRWIRAAEPEGPQPADVAAAVDEQTALVVLSHVAYRSGARADMAGITEVVHGVGALALWDVSHSVGSTEVELDRSGADLAAGCTYKYLNAGPGAPAFLYVSRAQQGRLRNPMWGWFGQQEQFAMGPTYEPAPGIRSWLVGTPDVLGLAAVEAGLALFEEVGLAAVAAKGRALTTLAVDLLEARLVPLGCSLGSPSDPMRRGAHVGVRHPQAWQVCQALIEAGVVPDFREPDTIRLGFPALYTGFVDVWDAIDAIATILDTSAHLRYPASRARVT